jgi:hypothetical protein
MTSDLEIYPDVDRTPATLFASPDPAAIVAQATRIANEIAPLIREQRLVKRIGQSDHVFLEGWTLAGTMLGVFPITVSSGPIVHEGEVLGYQATVEARTMAGNMVGRADAQCTHDENDKWKHAPSFQLRSMAITRASSKALRMPLGFVMHLAGYDATPAEEMEAAAARGETVSGGRGVRPGWRDLPEQQRAHAALGQLIDEHGLREWVAKWLESKSYERPLAKAQLAQLRRAIDREIAEKSAPAAQTNASNARMNETLRQSDPPSQPTPPGGDQGGSDVTSPSGSARDLNPDGDPTSGTGVTGASSQPVPDQTSEGGEREPGLVERHDPPSDPTSPGPVRGRQDPGTATSPPEARSTRGAPGGDATSGVGSRDAPAGSREGDPPAGSPTPDPSSGADEPSRVSEGTVHHPSHMGEAPPSAPDPSSPSGPARAQKAKAAERGDTNPGPAEQRSYSLLPEEGGEVEGVVGGSAGPAPRDLQPPIMVVPEGTAHPVEEWAIRQDPPVDLRVAKVAIRKEFKKDFGWLQDWKDLAELQGEQAVNAIKALEAIYLEPRSP